MGAHNQRLSSVGAYAAIHEERCPWTWVYGVFHRVMEPPRKHDRKDYCSTVSHALTAANAHLIVRRGPTVLHID